MFQEFNTELPRIAQQEFNILEFGAVPGGTVSNTAAFAQAIAAAAQQGGRVLVPDGIWLTGPITLRTNVELHLADNSLILFSKSREEYPLCITDYEGIRRIRTVSMISAEGAENIAITGRGTIDGNGQLWRPVKQFKVTRRQWDALLEQSPYVIEGNAGGIWVPTKSIYDGRHAGELFPDGSESDAELLKQAEPYYDFYRPVLLSLRNCRRVLLDGVRIQNSAAWAVHPYFCEDLTVRNITVYNPYFAQNGDGLDVDSCNRVHIHHCDFETGDDAICLKAGKDREARKQKKPCENVLIHNCRVGSGFGGFVIGSEMSRGVHNVLIRDCMFIDTDIGIRFKSAIGRGGTVEDIYMQDIQMINLHREAVILTMDYVHNTMDYNDPVAVTTDPEDIPEFRNLYFERCVSNNPDARVVIRPLEGYPDSIHNIYFKDCQLGTIRQQKLC